MTLPSPLIKNCRNKAVKMYFEKIASTFWSHQPHKDIALSSLVDILLFEMTNSNADSDDRDSGVAGEIVRAISAAPYRRYSLDEMAQMFSVSGRTIEDIMKRTVGMSFSKYQNAVKLEMAAQQIAAEPNIRLAEIAATLAFSAIHNNDKVGVVMFSDRIEKFIPPQKGSSHILRIIRELIGFRPAGNGTDIAEALRYFTNVTKKRSTAFLLSDMYDDNYENALKIAAGKHDLVVLHIDDIRERQLPRMGLVAFEDLESGQTRWVDTSSEKVRQNYETYYRTYNERCANLMQKYGIDYATISTGQDFVKPLIGLFKRRGV